MLARAWWCMVASAVMTVVVGCGGAAEVVVPARGTPAAVIGSPAAMPVGAVPPAPTPVVQPRAPSGPASTPAHAAPMAFVITPLFPAGAGGTVSVVVTNGLAHYHLEVTGLVPGSAHTIHDHGGSCAGGLASRHLVVLATASADSRGVIAVDATVPAVDFGPGRIVLVYQGARATVIAGCATL
jgi:hypothetical protein